MQTVRTILKIIFSILLLAVIVLLMGPSVEPPGDASSRIRTHTRAVEFDFAGWTANAILLKAQQAALGTAAQLDEEQQRQIVFDYLALIGEIGTKEAELEIIYTDPAIADPQAASQTLRTELDALYAQRANLGPLAESVLQNLVAAIFNEEGFTPGGQPIPPVLYHSSPLPWTLIISPRDTIQRDHQVSLEVDLNVADHAELEAKIEAEMGDISALVVPVGGIGAYPTMVAQTTNLNWLVEVIAHEWMHNYLTLRPLGMNYETTPELRTMNETTASLVGKEIGALVIQRYFPELAPPPPSPPAEEPADPQPTPTPDPAIPPPFDFRAEMHTTRLRVDELLAAGEIQAAEAYMETRRVFFWDNGYHIRKLNQAYFAFYGAYADVPGGAAGDDPVGEAVRTLHAQSDSLVGFVKQMAWLTSFEALQEILEK